MTCLAGSAPLGVPRLDQRPRGQDPALLLGLAARIEFGPTRLTINASPRDGMENATIVQKGIDPLATRIRSLHNHERGPALNTLCIDVGVFYRRVRLH